MPDHFDPYELLEIDRNASPEDIKRAYRSAARKYHPDVNPDPDAEEKMKEVSRAYEMLTNPDRQQQAQPHGPVGFTADDVMREVFSFHFRPSNDIRASVPMSLRQLLDGATITIVGQRRMRCPDCEGRGNSTVTCDDCVGTGLVDDLMCSSCVGTGKRLAGHCVRCNGGGFVPDQLRLELDIPPGLNVSPLTIRGKGHDGLPGEPSGNLIVMPRVELPQGCQVMGNTKLIVDLGVDPVLFVVGGDVGAKTPFGETVSVHIPDRANFGSLVGVDGFGLPVAFGCREPRDIILFRLLPEIPNDISSDRTELLREYIRLGDVGQSHENTE